MMQSIEIPIPTLQNKQERRSNGEENVNGDERMELDGENLDDCLPQDMCRRLERCCTTVASAVPYCELTVAVCLKVAAIVYYCLTWNKDNCLR